VGTEMMAKMTRLYFCNLLMRMNIQKEDF